MKLYNTLTRQKEDFIPINGNTVNMYVCGPTVYNFIHIGNARQLCVFDSLRKYLEYKGYKVNYIQNFTDVDDKIINKALENNIPATEVAENAIKQYFIDADGLNVKRASVHPRVTETINDIIAYVAVLIEKGFAYAAEDGVYFSTEKFPQYGKLSHMPLDELKENARAELNVTKRSPLDFAVWKFAKPNEPQWTAPFGNGRPGWHIECSVMAKKYCNNCSNVELSCNVCDKSEENCNATLDIHGGGADLIFPHHENEIAQSECLGKPLAKYWVHNGMITVDNQKMGKSKGNFFLVHDAAKKFGYPAVKMFLLSAHYRNQLNYSADVLAGFAKAWDRVKNCRELIKNSVNPNTETVTDFSEYKTKFIAHLEDDFNTADSMAVLFEFIKKINTCLSTGYSKADTETIKKLFAEFTGILGIDFPEDKEIPDNVLELAEQRAAARKNKDFALADKIRDEISALGFLIEETKTGVNVKRK
jgi:cysteinyl-tRNA synthetase